MGVSAIGQPALGDSWRICHLALKRSPRLLNFTPHLGNPTLADPGFLGYFAGAIARSQAVDDATLPPRKTLSTSQGPLTAAGRRLAADG